MGTYTQTELDEALRAYRSSIGKCEKVRIKLKDGCRQGKWIERQLQAFYISVSLIEQAANDYSDEQLSEAAKTLRELIEKIKAMAEKLKDGSPQKTLAVRRHKAFIIALELIEENA